MASSYGAADREIAQRRGSAERTVANQVQAIYAKLGVGSSRWAKVTMDRVLRPYRRCHRGARSGPRGERSLTETIRMNWPVCRLSLVASLSSECGGGPPTPK